MRPAVIVVSLAAAYPMLLIAGIARDVSVLRYASLVALLTAVFLPGLLAGRVAAWIGAFASIAACLWLTRRGAGMLPLLLAPVVIPAGVGWIFGRTLRPGNVPLIEQIVRYLHSGTGPVELARTRYARRLTIAWTVLLASLAVGNAVLGAFASPGGLLELAGIHPPLSVPSSIWAAWTGAAGYLVVAAFFVAEYAYRQWRFPDQPYDGFMDFLRRSAAIAPSLATGRSPSHGNTTSPDT